MTGFSELAESNKDMQSLKSGSFIRDSLSKIPRAVAQNQVIKEDELQNESSQMVIDVNPVGNRKDSKIKLPPAVKTLSNNGYQQPEGQQSINFTSLPQTTKTNKLNNDKGMNDYSRGNHFDLSRKSHYTAKIETGMPKQELMEVNDYSDNMNKTTNTQNNLFKLKKESENTF